ncbi:MULTISPECIES: AraC family transcriptional regulator [Sorangium]|uniref:AraC family transcriptional regulator n=1 Tax=Sorangium cellulosum TaxID=56 RepID=A0A4P2QGG8_SORCE|nr:MULTISPECIES: AraC family transcriptional regulator [Sorangium]AUX28954.1 AraC family transcriptional regulator [Sorangium cellulosum]WCQ88348.1 HTH-type transcriptional regulator MtrA [Sorangium sp. Soce836]
MSAALDELARSVALRETEVMRFALGERWGKRQPARRASARVYAARRGGGCIDVARRRLAFGAGELVFLPRADEHTIRDRPTTSLAPPDALCRGIHAVAEGALATEAPADTHLVIVDLHLDAAGAPWLALLPPAVHVTGATPGLARWLTETLALLAGAPDLSPALRRSIGETWAHALFASALRDPGASLPRAEALRDEPVVAALARVRASPERAWELAELARQAGLSRSAFAARATALLGEPLGHHVRRLRLQRAAVLLGETTLPVKLVAARVGYDSEPAFARAFARAHGVSPVGYRQARRREDGAPEVRRAG